MDSNPSLQQQAAASSQPVNETPTSTPSPLQAATSGFSSFHLDLASGLFECVNQAARVDEETRRVVHVPAGRRLLVEGFEILATMHGTLFAMMCDQWGYDRNAFYDAISSYMQSQRAAYQKQEIAKAAGITVEELEAKLKAEADKQNAKETPHN